MCMHAGDDKCSCVAVCGRVHPADLFAAADSMHNLNMYSMLTIAAQDDKADTLSV